MDVPLNKLTALVQLKHQKETSIDYRSEEITVSELLLLLVQERFKNCFKSQIYLEDDISCEQKLFFQVKSLKIESFSKE